MSSNSIKLFNIQLINFAKVLVKRFPTDSELKFALTGIETLYKVNPKKNLEIFTMYIYKYRDKIMDQNEDFLLKTDFLDDNPDLNTSGAFDIMKRLKSNWSELDASDKTNVWKYLKVLISLDDKCIKSTLQNTS
jgi:hypothetical protein